jgi:hypothetical protein
MLLQNFSLGARRLCMKISVLLIVTYLSMVAIAQATPITWTLDLALDDGATVTGSFTFDPDLGSNQGITNFKIVVSSATPGILREPFDEGLPTSVFFPFNFFSHEQFWIWSRFPQRRRVRI